MYFLHRLSRQIRKAWRTRLHGCLHRAAYKEQGARVVGVACPSREEPTDLELSDSPV